MALTPKIAPSLLSCDFTRLGEDSERMLALGAEWLHCDIMDGHFVNNLTIGAPIIKALRDRLPSAFLDCHLMVDNPTRWLKDFKDAGASQVTLHIETLSDEALASQATLNPNSPHFKTAIEALDYVRNILKIRVGVAVKPGTPVDSVEHLLDHVDMILIMTVEPGFGGQAFMPEVMPKVARIRSLRPLLDIEVDGGLGPSTIAEAANAGANVIVAGNAIFKAKDPGAVINLLRDEVNKNIKQ